ncbi:hypothetical protein AVEN_72564-1 [Araneus ventricosus]|uniref:Uncharacterized protein n=1 Tax=Araneus ventricosus TaxID=182803 RepID=A0A4Y2MJ81_ARAVE|nr:hypothetical protein AVEN_72564-1 [Araneus ventricosus]
MKADEFLSGSVKAKPNNSEREKAMINKSRKRMPAFGGRGRKQPDTVGRLSNLSCSQSSLATVEWEETYILAFRSAWLQLLATAQ